MRRSRASSGAALTFVVAMLAACGGTDTGRPGTGPGLGGGGGVPGDGGRSDASGLPGDGGTPGATGGAAPVGAGGVPGAGGAGGGVGGRGGAGGSAALGSGAAGSAAGGRAGAGGGGRGGGAGHSAVVGAGGSTPGGAGGSPGVESCRSNFECPTGQVCYSGTTTCAAQPGGRCVTRESGPCSGCGCIDAPDCTTIPGATCLANDASGACWLCAAPQTMPPR